MRPLRQDREGLGIMVTILGETAQGNTIKCKVQQTKRGKGPGSGRLGANKESKRGGEGAMNIVHGVSEPKKHPTRPEKTKRMMERETEYCRYQKILYIKSKVKQKTRQKASGRRFREGRRKGRLIEGKGHG